MKAIKITEANRQAIATALAAINGKATAHTYDAADVLRIAQDAEAHLLRLVPKKSAQGAILKALSGEKVPNAYKYSRAATLVHLERRSTGWFLISAKADTVYQQGGYITLTLTQDQDAEAIRAFRSRNYLVRSAT